MPQGPGKFHLTCRQMYPPLDPNPRLLGEKVKAWNSLLSLSWVSDSTSVPNRKYGSSTAEGEAATTEESGVQDPKWPQEIIAVPLIQIQRPSRDPSEVGPSYPNDDDLRAHAKVQRSPKDLQAIAEGRTTGKDIELVAIMPQPTSTVPRLEKAHENQSKKRRVLQRTRNVFNQMTYLKATLGRRLATPTKEALRHQANGEDVTITEIKVVN